MKDHVKDQAKFAERCREIIADLGLPAEFEDPMEGDTDQDDIETIDESDESSQSFLRKMLFWMMRQWRGGVEGEASMMDMDSDMDMDEAGAEADPDGAGILN